jgi:hypothetical protein
LGVGTGCSATQRPSLTICERPRTLHGASVSCRQPVARRQQDVLALAGFVSESPVQIHDDRPPRIIMQSRTAAGTLASAALRVVPSGMLKTIPGLPTVLAAAPGQPHQPSWMYHVREAQGKHPGPRRHGRADA